MNVNVLWFLPPAAPRSTWTRDEDARFRDDPAAGFRIAFVLLAAAAAREYYGGIGMETP